MSLPELARFPFSRPQPLDPPPMYATARGERPILPVQLWNGRRAWLITRYDDATSVLSDPRFSAELQRPGFPTISEGREAVDKEERAFIGMDDPDHGRFRRMVTREFSVKRMQEMAPQIADIVDSLLDELLAAGPPADLVEDVAVRLPSMVMCDFIGSPYEDHKLIMASQRARHQVAGAANDAVEGSRRLVEYALQLIHSKEEQPGDDLVSRLVADYLRTGKATREQLSQTIAILLRAGHDTTANMISLGTLVLLSNPEQIEDLRSNLAVARTAVDELLRYLSPVQYAPRRLALEDVELRDVMIPKGEGVYILAASANRDEAVFPDSDRLDVHRDASHHLAFGFGVHQCLGQPLARIELQIFFPKLFQRIPSLRLATSPSELVFKDNMQVYGVEKLPIAW
jgi:cytochrome P450